MALGWFGLIAWAWKAWGDDVQSAISRTYRQTRRVAGSAHCRSPLRVFPAGRLLFRSPHITDPESPLTDLRDMLNRVAVGAGLRRADSETGKEEGRRGTPHAA